MQTGFLFSKFHHILMTKLKHCTQNVLQSYDKIETWHFQDKIITLLLECIITKLRQNWDITFSRQNYNFVIRMYRYKIMTKLRHYIFKTKLKLFQSFSNFSISTTNSIAKLHIISSVTFPWQNYNFALISTKIYLCYQGQE